jgi:hypothetical protein
VPDGLDGVRPPPGCADPTLVVWREYGHLRDRLLLYAVIFGMYAGVAVFVELIGPGRLYGTFSFVFDGVCLLFALGQGWLMTNPGEYYAAGSTWMLAWTTSPRHRPGEEEARARRVLKFADLRQAQFRTTRKPWSRAQTPMVRFEDVHHTAWVYRLSLLQRCPPIVALIDPALARPDVTIDPGLREALRQPPRLHGAPAGRTVVRAGSGL